MTLAARGERGLTLAELAAADVAVAEGVPPASSPTRRACR